jgi:DNA-binding transcriptional regulator YiaG
LEASPASVAHLVTLSVETPVVAAFFAV